MVRTRLSALQNGGPEPNMKRNKQKLLHSAAQDRSVVLSCTELNPSATTVELRLRGIYHRDARKGLDTSRALASCYTSQSLLIVTKSNIVKVLQEQNFPEARMLINIDFL